MPVAELLERTSSAELGEWQAFEKAYGPLGNSYTENALAEVVDAIERLRYTTTCLNVAQEDADDIEVPMPMPRPPDVAPRSDDEAEDADEEEA